jgi:hypothetical protein
MRIKQSCLDFDTMLQYKVDVDLPSGDCFLLPFFAVPFSFDLILFRLNPHLVVSYWYLDLTYALHMFLIPESLRLHSGLERV